MINLKMMYENVKIERIQLKRMLNLEYTTDEPLYIKQPY